MIDINEVYEKEIRLLIDKFGKCWRKALDSKGKNGRSKDRSYLVKYILERTNFLDNVKTDFKTRVVCCLRHQTEVPRCQNPKCRKPLSKYLIDNVLEERPRETMFCSHKCIYEAKESPDSFIYFNKDYPAKEDKVKFLKKLVVDYPLTYQRVLQGKDYVEVAKWVYDAVPILQEKCYNTATRLYWIINGLTDFPTCRKDGCVNKVGVGKVIKITQGYCQYCSRQCAGKSELTQQHAIETLNRNNPNEKVSNPGQLEKVKKKIRETTFKNNGVFCSLQTKKCREKSREALRKKKETADIVRAAEKARLKKEREEKLIGSSFAEDQIFTWLNYAFNGEVLKHYKSEKYPYFCDFYIPSKDLYIEFNGTWTHNKHPYDENSDDDKKRLSYMKQHKSNYYKNAIYVWTRLDVKKRQIAKSNRINFIEWWSMNEAAKWIAKNSIKEVPFVPLLKYKFKKSIFNPTLLEENVNACP